MSRKQKLQTNRFFKMKGWPIFLFRIKSFYFEWRQRCFIGCSGRFRNQFTIKKGWIFSENIFFHFFACSKTTKKLEMYPPPLPPPPLSLSLIPPPIFVLNAEFEKQSVFLNVILFFSLKLNLVIS